MLLVHWLKNSAPPVGFHKAQSPNSLTSFLYMEPSPKRHGTFRSMYSKHYAETPRFAERTCSFIKAVSCEMPEYLANQQYSQVSSSSISKRTEDFSDRNLVPEDEDPKVIVVGD